MLRLLLVLLTLRFCAGEEHFPKCCDSESVLVNVNSTYTCSRNTSRRIEILANSTNFLEDGPGDGLCVDVDGEVALFRLNGTEVSRERELRVDFYPKCCPMDYFYNTTTHGCVRAKEKLETFFNEKFVKVGLPQCNVIVDVNFNPNKLNRSSVRPNKENKMYSEGLWCADRDENDLLVARICQNDFTVCDKVKCIRKCCPDGQSFINGSKCYNTYVHGLDLPSLSSNMDGVNDSFVVVHGFNPPLYPLYPNRFHFHLYENGTFMQSEIDDHLEIRYVSKYYDVEEEAYCIEHAVKNAMNGFYFFRGFPKMQKHVKFFYTGIAMALSCFFLSLTILYYCCSNEKRTVFGKSLISYCSATLTAFLLLTYLAFVTNRPDKIFCVIFTFLIFYSSLASFTWMNVMCVDIFWTFRSPKSFSSRQHSKGLKRFILYSLYGWGSPLVLTLIPLIFYHVNVLPPALQVSIDQEENNKRCFIYKGKGNYAQLLFFTTPLALLELCNLVMFIKTAVYCLKVKREIDKMNDTHTAKGERKQKFNNFRDSNYRYILLIKLLLIMGISFIFEVVSTFYSFRTNRVAVVIEIVWDTFNSLQGFFIFVIFIVKKRILKMLGSKVGLRRLRKFSLVSSVMTHTSSVPTLNSTKQ